MSFLLDTDTCSAHLKRPSGLASRFEQYYGRLHISVVTLGELLTWTYRRDAPPKRLVKVNELLRSVAVLQVTASVAECFSRIRAAQLDTGRPSPYDDLWIASTAIAHNLTLVTHNTRDFEGIPGLALADWLTP